MPTTTSRCRFWYSGRHRMCAPSRKTVSGEKAAFVPASPRCASSLLILSAMRPKRFRTVVFNWAEQGRNISINRAASRNECLDPNSACRRRSFGIARSGKSPPNGDCGPGFATPADWHEQCRILGDFTRNRPNIVSNTQPPPSKGPPATAACLVLWCGPCARRSRTGPPIPVRPSSAPQGKGGCQTEWLSFVFIAPYSVDIANRPFYGGRPG